MAGIKNWKSSKFITPQRMGFISTRFAGTDGVSLESAKWATCWRRTSISASGMPGGSIMIHGLPNEPRKDFAWYSTQDWTDGCIAVSNADMVEIWMLVSDNTPIEIQP